MRKPPPCALPREEGSRLHRSEEAIQPPSVFLSAEAARAEATRCLSLRPCEGCEICELLCPDQAVTRDSATGRPVIDLRYCKGCGLCAHLCPKGAISMVLEQDAD